MPRQAVAKVLYVGLTLESTLRTVYDEILTQIFLRHRIPAEPKYKNQIVFSNGSRIYCLGVDANRKEKEKFRGFKGALVVVDECQSHEQDLRVLLNEILGPTLADTKSPVWLLGTAGNKKGTNYWHEVTRLRKHPQWWVYESSWRDNDSIESNTGRRVCDNVREYLEELQRLHPGIERTSGFRQEWLGEWVEDSTAHIYTYRANDDRPSAAFLDTATYVLGLDLGYNDPTAMVVVAYNTRHSSKLYVVDSFCQSGMLVPDIVAKIRELDRRYHFVHMVGDSASLQVFETLRETYSLPLEKADKAGKLSHQLVINSDFVTGNVVVLPTAGNGALVDQLQTVIWREDKLAEGKHVEDPAFKNDLTDALLYAHHFSRHQWYEPPKPPKGLPTNADHEAILRSIMFKQQRERLSEVDYAAPANYEFDS